MMRDCQTGLYYEKYFNEFITLERKRRGRAEGQELLLLADLSAFTDVSERQRIAQSMMDVFSKVTRDTDVKGWHVDGMVIGIMFTEMTCEEVGPSMVQKYVAKKCLRSLETHLGMERFSRIHISWQPLHGEYTSKIHSASKL
jgi:hypothetical protein